MAENEKNELTKTADKSEAKVKAKKKAGLGSRIVGWFRSCKSEMKKIVWASPKSVLSNFILVAVVVVILGLAIGVLDVVFLQAINALSLIF